MTEPSIGSALAGSLPTSTPEEVGLSSDRLKRVHALVQRYIEKGEIAGAVSLVARRGRIAHFESQGLMDLETRKPLRNDSIFRLASMTMPVTSLAVMMLHEEGHFLLDDPVAKFLPEFKDSKVAVANAPNERYEPGYRLIPAERPSTPPASDALRRARQRQRRSDHGADESTHGRPQTGGCSGGLHPPPGRAAAEFPARRLGVRTRHSVLVRLVEVISGQSLDQFFRKRILTPLEMNDTWFYLPDDRLPRLAAAYAKKNGALEKLTAPGPASQTGSFYSGTPGVWPARPRITIACARCF